ncbi:glycolate oxidase [Paractinoplanes abujensis]|uniref:Glycolate oxidase FAD binding subunit n=1 Tax=Paractinoplanes abujensis TaxID=882441 RepID=A0A7W7CLZ7_9ACTN|nr:FAD-binding oxidoreductase [Actinoplanes abujensis]MBB4690724.1 glycolate oxidase FAD binding subunit [Actinoplanes abujensis]GID17863.1 glycolate oxidase [Actinoplanes abujensis]
MIEDLTRPATGDDHVGGVPARLVAEPATTEEAAAVVAAARDLTVVVRGGGTKIHWGPPPRALDLIIDTRRLAGMVEHAAGDLITVLRAGTPLDDLDLGDQQLALDHPPGATVGGTVATATSGPRRMHYGTARDLLIGITVVRPDGTITKAGGKVVKNVAGYDLGKLYTGSYGTLGLITECVFRLHPRPQAHAYVRSTAPAQAVPSILAARVAPAAIEVDSATGELAVLIEGTPEGVQERAALVGKLLAGEIAEQPPGWWGVPPWSADGIGMKLSVPLSKVPALLDADADVRGSAGTGVLYAAARDITDVERLRALCVRGGGHAVVLTAPAPVRDILDMWGPVPGLALMRRVKDQFDPGHRFAPGRFVGGI